MKKVSRIPFFGSRPSSLTRKCGTNEEMQSVLNCDVFEEFKLSDLTPEQLETAISKNPMELVVVVLLCVSMIRLLTILVKLTLLCPLPSLLKVGVVGM